MINLRKLVALDMVIHGERFIVAEFAAGIVLPLIPGLLSIRSFWGLWLVGIAMNYVPLFIYAVSIARAGTAKEEGQSELEQIKRYGIQQVIILVPLLVLGLTLIQEVRHQQK
jgi:hypothetical protein